MWRPLCLARNHLSPLSLMEPRATKMPVFPGCRTPFFCWGWGGTVSFPKGHVCLTNCPQIFLVFQGIAANKTDVFIASVKIRDNFNPLFLPSPSVCLSITSLAFFPHLTPSATVTHSLCKQVCSRTNAQTPSITTHQVSPTIQASRHTMRRRNTRLHTPRTGLEPQR